MASSDTIYLNAGVSQAGGSAVSERRSHVLLGLLLLSMLLPVIFNLAGMALSPVRIFLLIAFVPLCGMLLAGKYGAVNWSDKLMLLHGVWMLVALVVVHGTARIPFAGISAVELIGAYLAGRAFVRNEADYRFVFRFVLVALLVLLPFAAYESFTGRMIIPEFLSRLGEAPDRARSAYGRMGLERVYSVFAHPILWGLFCSITLANFWSLAHNRTTQFFCLMLTLYTTMTSLSSGPLLSCSLQVFLLLWNWVTGGKWKVLIILSVVGYVVIDALSNRTPVTILIETLTFNVGSSWTRILIFEYGWAAVKRSPIFGIGFNDWPRPFWLTSSVDNFWLLTAMRYGLVGAILLVLAFLAHIKKVVKAPVEAASIRQLRLGYMIALVGVMFSLAAVHIWGGLASFVMFYLGAGAWLYNTDLGDTPNDQSSDAQNSAERNTLKYSRFAPGIPPRQRRKSGAEAIGPGSSLRVRNGSSSAT